MSNALGSVWAGESEEASSAHRGAFVEIRERMWLRLFMQWLCSGTGHSYSICHNAAAEPGGPSEADWQPLPRLQLDQIQSEILDAYLKVRSGRVHVPRPSEPWISVVAAKKRLDDHVRAGSAPHPFSSPIPLPERWKEAGFGTVFVREDDQGEIRGSVILNTKTSIWEARITTPQNRVEICYRGQDPVDLMGRVDTQMDGTERDAQGDPAPELVAEPAPPSEWIACIAKDGRPSRFSEPLCGNPFGRVFLLDLDHAKSTIASESRLEPCEACLRLALDAQGDVRSTSQRTDTPAPELVAEPGDCRWWISWTAEEGPSLITPWWWEDPYGHRSYTYYAAVLAPDEVAAVREVVNSYGGGTLCFRFVERKSDNWHPWSERFPHEPWMIWPVIEEYAMTPEDGERRAFELEDRYRDALKTGRIVAPMIPDLANRLLHLHAMHPTQAMPWTARWLAEQCLAAIDELVCGKDGDEDKGDGR